MCRKNWADPWFDYPQTQPVHIQCFPRFEWAMPVSIAELAGSLEAYTSNYERILTLQLCYRFRLSQLSRLPQELFNHVIAELLEPETQRNSADWAQQLKCVQRRCEPREHENRYDIWSPGLRETFVQAYPEHGSSSEEEARALWREFLYTFTDEELWNDYIADYGGYHNDLHSKWMQRTCTCEPEGSFVELNKFLATCFGLKAIILHETLYDEFTTFLPGISSINSDTPCLNTCCYLVSTSAPPLKCVGDTQELVTAPKSCSNVTNGQSMSQGRIVDISLLGQSENQRRKFARVRQVLRTSPHFNIGELDRVKEREKMDNDLRKISNPGADNVTEGEGKTVRGLECYLAI